MSALTFPIIRSVLIGTFAVTIHKQSPEYGTKQESTYVCQISDSSCLDRSYAARIPQLDEEPHTDQKRSRNKRDTHKNEDDQERANPIMRIEDKKSAHHCGDGSTCTQI